MVSSLCRSHYFGTVNPQPAKELEMLMLQHFTATLPSIALQTDLYPDPCTNMLELGIPVVYLDWRPRLPLLQRTKTERVFMACEHFRNHLKSIATMSAKRTDKIRMVERSICCSIAHFHNVLYGDGNYGKLFTLAEEDAVDTSLFHAIKKMLSSNITVSDEMSADVAPIIDPPAHEDIKMCIDLLVQHIQMIFIHPKTQLEKWDNDPWFMIEHSDIKAQESAQMRWKSIYASMTNRKFTSGHVVINQADVRAKIDKLLMTDRLPDNNSASGLLLLRDAWDVVDVCAHVAARYKMLTKVLYIVFLFLGVAITSVAVLRFYPFLTNHSLGPVGLADALLFILAVAQSITSSIMAFMTPAARWRSVRATGENMESAIWQFRTRVANFHAIAGNDKRSAG